MDYKFFWKLKIFGLSSALNIHMERAKLQFTTID